MKNSFLRKYGFSIGAAALFFVLLLIVFRQFVFDSSLLMLNSDQLNSLGSRVVRTDHLIATEWDDSRLGGVPTIDALFGDIYHPLVLIHFLGDALRGIGFKFIVTIWFAFVSAMLLARSMTGSDKWGALLGYLYAFSPAYFTYVYGGHDGKMMVFAAAPFALLCLRKIVRDGSLGYFIGFTLSLVWMILSSHLQLTYLFLWGAGFYTLYEMFALKATWTVRGKRLGLAAGALALGLVISSFQIIPPYLYTTGQSVRGTGERTEVGHATSWSLHQEELAGMLLPGFIGVDVYEEKQGTLGTELDGSSFVNFSVSDYQNAGVQGSPFYWGHNPFKLNHDSCGILLTFLAFLCFFLPGKRRWAIFWSLGAALVLTYAMGAHSPLFRLWYTILPGIKSFRAPSMALFWMPLLMVMMACPVLKAFEDPENRKKLLGGLVMFGLLMCITLFARYHWETFLGAGGFIVALVYGLLFLAVLNVQDKGQSLSFANVGKALTGGLKGSSRIEQVCILVPYILLGLFMLSAQNLVADPDTSAYFKPLNEGVMIFAQSKVLAGFFLAAFIVACTWVVCGLKCSVARKALILGCAAGLELYFIDAAFIQNVPEANYYQPDNAVIRALEATYPDSLNAPRVLSLSRSQALSGNSFPLYRHLRNADGFHDNELASYRNFRGGQQDTNFLLNINNPGAAHPFLDLMNIGAIIFDTQQGTTFIPNPGAMGEAFLYGQSVTMDDSAAIATLRTGTVRKIAMPAPADSASRDSTGKDTAQLVPGNPQGFLYKETIILSERPEHQGAGGIPQGYAKLVASPKMDTQVFEVQSDRAGFMLVSGNYHKYWNATVNGKPTKVYKAFGTLRAVEIPAGKSQVVMQYRSRTFHECLWAGLAGVIVLAGIGGFAIYRKVRGCKAVKA